MISFYDSIQVQWIFLITNVVRNCNVKRTYNAIDIFMKITVNYSTVLSDCQLAIDALVRSYLTSFGKVSDYRTISRVDSRP